VAQDNKTSPSEASSPVKRTTGESDSTINLWPQMKIIGTPKYTIRAFGTKANKALKLIGEFTNKAINDCYLTQKMTKEEFESNVRKQLVDYPYITIKDFDVTVEVVDQYSKPFEISRDVIGHRFIAAFLLFYIIGSFDEYKNFREEYNLFFILAVIILILLRLATQTHHLSRMRYKLKLKCGYKSEYVLIEGKIPFVYYNQGDCRWRDSPYSGYENLEEAGCGPTAFAMAAATLINDWTITPVEIADLAQNTGLNRRGTEYIYMKTYFTIYSYGMFYPMEEY